MTISSSWHNLEKSECIDMLHSSQSIMAFKSVNDGIPHLPCPRLRPRTWSPQNHPFFKGRIFIFYRRIFIHRSKRTCRSPPSPKPFFYLKSPPFFYLKSRCPGLCPWSPHPLHQNDRIHAPCSHSKEVETGCSKYVENAEINEGKSDTRSHVVNILSLPCVSSPFSTTEPWMMMYKQSGVSPSKNT